MNDNEIKKIALGYLKNLSKINNIEFILLENETILEDEFYVFFYDSKEFIDTGDSKYILAGNSPIIISKKDGEVFETGTAYPIEYYIENFKLYGDPNGGMNNPV